MLFCVWAMGGGYKVGWEGGRPGGGTVIGQGHVLRGNQCTCFTIITLNLNELHLRRWCAVCNWPVSRGQSASPNKAYNSCLVKAHALERSLHPCRQARAQLAPVGIPRQT